MEVKNQLNQQVEVGVRETILKLFDDLSHKHSWREDNNTNIYMYNAWKTTKAHKINKKVIISLNGYNSWGDGFDPLNYQCVDKLLDIEKTFNYLDSGKNEEVDLREVLKEAKENNQTKGVISKYFKIDFYLKGSCHMTFLDLDLLKKFNIYAAMNKAWLPPSYSKKNYKDMTNEEKIVIDNFEGEKEYNKTMLDKEYFIYDTSQILMLSGDI